MKFVYQLLMKATEASVAHNDDVSNAAIGDDVDSFIQKSGSVFDDQMLVP